MADEDDSAAKGRVGRVYKKLEQATKIIGVVVAAITAIGFLVPSLGEDLSLLTAWRFGVHGYVYYEVGANRALTCDGQLYLLKEGPGNYEDIRWGDKLQANSEVNFYDGPKNTYAQIFLLRKLDCVVVLKNPADQVVVHHAASGGYLWVSTAACGLFK